jgi:hypothetical protein
MKKDARKRAAVNDLLQHSAAKERGARRLGERSPHSARGQADSRGRASRVASRNRVDRDRADFQNRAGLAAEIEAVHALVAAGRTAARNGASGM